MKIDLNLPLFPTTTVGSFPKPKYLVEARAKFYKNEISRENLLQLEEKATAEFIALQEKVGLDVFVDGEAERGDMATFFAERLGGFEISEPVRSYGNRYYKKPRIVDAIEFREPMTKHFFEFAQKLTSKPVKGMLTGPYTMMDWSFNEHYNSREEVVRAFAKVLRKEAEELQKAGCKIIQVDEPALSVRSDEIELAAEGLRLVTEGLEMYSITHICYGAFEHLAPKIKLLPVDQIDLEFAGRDFELLDQLKGHEFPQDVGLGVYDVHTHKTTPKEKVAEYLEKALTYFKPEQIWIDPDCGLKTRSLSESEEGLREMVLAAGELRNKK
ncbi:methionine synthase [Candidatus Gracilibacteria bacterium]|nr:methionine synthase [Candidatus Gracilibacteria bacterium]MCF7856831.1 methionine synthase [Candidatus Gracilibacteria bacterium]MCF7897095.1 methionine synthase [Candidatus Gracilibacteria bacterium]